MRRSRDSWVIGRMETGKFIAVPPAAYRVIELLGHGHTVGEVTRTLCVETGSHLAVSDFVTALDELGFVAAIDGEPRHEPRQPPTLPRLRPAHVRWLLHPAVAAVVALAALATVIILVARPELVPSYHDLVWSHHAGLVMAVNGAIAWALVALHELGHMATSRAAGAPARISLSTRLQFLVAQTDTSGVWAESFRVRMTIYLAGMAVDLCTGAVCLVILAVADPHGLAHSLLAVIVAEEVLFLLGQGTVFIRTDLYFVLQDITGCANMYADGCRYLGYAARRVWCHLRRAADVPPDPTMALRPAERRSVRGYSVVLLAGTAVCLAVELGISIPALTAIVARMLTEATCGSPSSALDCAAALSVVASFQVLWCTAWWRRHGHRIRGWFSPRIPQSGGRR